MNPTIVVLQNTAKVKLVNKLPSDEGRELLLLPMHCVDVLIGQNAIVSQKKY